MLKVMRESFEHLKWILIVIVAIFILFIFAQWGGGGGDSSQAPATSYAARVNGQTISLRQYERALYYTQKNYEQMTRQNITEAMMDTMGLKKQVMDSLVDETLMLQQAKKLHLAATPDEVRRRILELPAFNPDGKFIGWDLYNRYVTGTLGFGSPAEFESDLAREITRGKMESALVNSIVISPKAAAEEYRRVTENSRIHFVLYPSTRMIASVTVTPAEVDAFYKKNIARYSHSEQRDVKYLIADLARIRGLMNPPDTELRARYDATKENWKSGESARSVHILVKVAQTATPAEDAAAKAKAQGLLNQLRGGADFATLAKKSSDDPGSATRGGDLGFLTREQLVPEFANAAFALPIGQLSDLVKTSYGYHIIKVMEKRPAGYKPFEDVRDQIRSQIVEQNGKDQAREAITRVRALMDQKKPTSPEQFTAFANDKVSSNDTQWFSKSDPIAGLGHNPALAGWAFAAKQGDVGDVMGTQRGPAIPYLLAIRPAGISPLAEIRDRVELEAKMDRARDLARDTMARAMPAPTIDALAAKLGLTGGDATVTSAGTISGINGDTQALADAALAAKPGELKGPVLVGDGAVAFQVMDQHKVDRKMLDENKSAYTDSLRQREAQTLRAVLLERLRKSSKIDVNNSLIQPKSTQPAV
jgi:peptidyl-prolyl cis-trans isomerase D